MKANTMILVNIFCVMIFGVVSNNIIEAKSKVGFSIDIIHRDSPKSPLFIASESTTQRLRKDLLRSVHRVNYFKENINAISNGTTPVSTVIPSGGGYLMNISIGTPTFQILAIADTGSDLIWTQCRPCNPCFQQKAPLFDPKTSTTYKELPCSSRSCQSGCESGDSCQYSVSYGDNSHSNGVVALDTLTLASTTGRPISIKGTFGCGFDNAGTFDQNTSGIIGLGGGSESLISQLDSLIDGVFSYCLVQHFSTPLASSKLNFGTNGIVSGSNVVSTPLVQNTPATFYRLTLEGISVDGERFNLNSNNNHPTQSSSPSKGNIIIDSGTTLTLLPQDLYENFESAVAQKIKLKRIQDPTREFSLCYQTDSEIKIPSIIFHFDEADLELQSYNTFLPLTGGVQCFAFQPVSLDDQIPPIFGNIAQMNFLVGYDLVKKVVSFKHTDCTANP